MGRALVAALIAAVAVGCGSLAGASARVDTPAGVVRQMLSAMESGDRNAYLDSLTVRARANPINPYALGRLASGLIRADLGPRVSFRDLAISELEVGSERALVKLTGRMRWLDLAMETPLDSIVVVRREGGQWLVSDEQP